MVLVILIYLSCQAVTPFLLAIIELKDTALSSFDAFGQAASEASNGVIGQLSFLIPSNECIVPFICTNGVNYIFGCATILPDSFVNFSVLSPYLNITSNDHLTIATLFLAKFRRHCINFNTKYYNNSQLIPVKDRFALKIGLYHIKNFEKIVLQYPNAQGWKRYMDIYVKLWSHEPMRIFIVFPISFYIWNVVEEPCILFNRLDNDWNIGVPTDFREQYCSKLNFVVKMLQFSSLRFGTL
jgi:hypothetical protein